MLNGDSDSVGERTDPMEGAPAGMTADSNAEEAPVLAPVTPKPVMKSRLVWLGGFLAFFGALSDPQFLGLVAQLLLDKDIHALLPPEWVSRVMLMGGILVAVLRVRTDQPLR